MNFPNNIYCDLDGVLVNFADTVLERMHRYTENLDLISEPKTKKAAIKAIQKTGRKQFTYKDIDYPPNGNKYVVDFMYRCIKNDSSFWQELPWLDTGKNLWKYLISLNVNNLFILTSPTDEASKVGKANWVEKNLHLPNSKIFFSSNKEEYATNSKGLPNILIDDTNKNIINFKNAGGIVFHCYSKVFNEGLPVEQIIKSIEDIRKHI